MKRITIGDLPLPEELVRDIFLRLSVKILCGCKVVCKQWCGFIESPSFVSQHFCESKERLLLRVGIFVEPAPAPDHGVVNAIIVDEDPEFDDPEFDDQEFDDQELEELVEPKPFLVGYKYALSVDEKLSEFEEPCHLQMPKSVRDLLGPFNGVFCLISKLPYGPSALLNPATRQFKPLPLVEPVELPDRFLFADGLGIGLDPLTGDYKLVLLMYFLHSHRDEFDYQCVVSVCSSDSDSWRLIEDVDPNVSHSSRCVSRDSVCNTYLNGVYYWLLEFFDSTSDVATLAFDMRTEKLKETRVMGPVPQSKSGNLALRGDSLVLLMYDTVDRCIDLWMMLDEGCWIKSSRVGPLEGITCPLYFWKNNELLFEAEAEAEADGEAEVEENSFLNSYNVTTQKLSDLKVMRNEGNSFWRWAFIYKESLVSLKGKSGKCRLWDTRSDFMKDFFN